jgi:hypothetical protein
MRVSASNLAVAAHALVLRMRAAPAAPRSTAYSVAALESPRAARLLWSCCCRYGFALNTLLVEERVL